MEINIKLLKIQNRWWDTNNLKYDLAIESIDSSALKFTPKSLSQQRLESGTKIFIEGARGVGKSTLIKTQINELIYKKKVDPCNILYYSCHNLNSKEQLNEIIKTFVNWRRNENKISSLLYVFIDEVALIKNWDKGLLYLEEAGLLKNVCLLLSGSQREELGKDLLGSLSIKKIQLEGLSFKEFVAVINPETYHLLCQKEIGNQDFHKRLDYFLDIYLMCGGYISAIDSFAKNSRIEQDIYRSYLYWMLADVARTGRDLILFRQVLEQIITMQGKSFGYNTLVKRTKAQTHNTVGDYIGILHSMFVTQTLYQYKDDGETNRSANKKIFFNDPFIFWVFHSYIYGSISYWQYSRDYVHDSEIFKYLLENIVFNHLSRSETTNHHRENVAFYRDNRKKEEISFIDFTKKEVKPILMRYQTQVSDNDIKIFKRAGFRGGTIISRNRYEKKGNLEIVPLSYFLFYT